MPVNPYFENGTASEQQLHEDLIIEAIQIHGLDVYYLPRKIVEKEKILNDEVLSKFKDAYEIEMYVKDVDGFGGQDLLSRFGLTIKDEITFVVAKRRWQELVQIPHNILDQRMPHEGDLLYFPLSKGLFEIRFVEDEAQFYPLKNLPIFELRCEAFTYENQKIETGFEDIDSIPKRHAGIVNVLIDTIDGYSLDLQVNEDIDIITPETMFSGRILNIRETPYGVLASISNLVYPEGKIIPLAGGFILAGSMSGSQAIITEVIRLDDSRYREYTNDPFGKNDQFEQKYPDLIDFSENNPFGEL